MKQTKTLEMKRHPTELWVLALIYALFMWAFGGLMAGLVLFLNVQMHVDLKITYKLFATFASLMWTLPLLGGYLSEKFGYKQSSAVGQLFCIFGLLSLFSHNLLFIKLGLAGFVVGNALYTPALWCLVDYAYLKDDPRRESGFTLFYLMFNIGAMAGIFVGGYIAKMYNFEVSFAVSAVLMLFGLILYALLVPSMKFEVSRSLKPKLKLSSTSLMVILAVIAVVWSVAALVLFKFTFLNDWLLYCLLAVAIISLLWICKEQKNKKARMKVLGFLLLGLIAIVFWTLYNFEPSVLSVFIEHNVIKHVFGIHIPAESFFGFEGLCVVILGLLFSRLWWYLAKQHRDPALSYKFSMSLVLIGLGFVYLFVVVLSNGYSNQLPMLWVILAYVFFASGELLIGPLGISMVGRLSPHGREGFFMGIWQLFMGVGAVFVGALAAISAVPQTDSLATSNGIYAHLFLYIGLSSVAVGIVAFIAAPWIKRLL